MATSVQGRLAVRGATLLLWFLAAGSCVYWGLKIAPAGARSAVLAPARAPAAADPAAIARLLGASPAATPTTVTASLASRFSLLGVVAERSHDGAALIAVDGKPPRPYRVGAAVDDTLVLQSVQPRRAVLSNGVGGPAVVTLELPPIKR